MDVAQVLGTFSLRDFLTSVFVLLFCIKQAGELLGWFLAKTGIETKTFRKIKNDAIKLEKHDTMLNKIWEKIDGLDKKFDDMSKELKETKRESDDRRMAQIRREILEFANRIKEDQPDKEMCDEIFELHDEYEALLVRWGNHNGRTTRAMREIEEYYQQL